MCHVNHLCGKWWAAGETACYDVWLVLPLLIWFLQIFSVWSVGGAEPLTSN